MKTILTGIKPTGMPHLGNLLGAIKPAIELSKTSDFDNFLELLLNNMKKSILGSIVKELIIQKKNIETLSYDQLYDHGLEQINFILQDSFHEGAAPVDAFKRFIKSIKKERSQKNIGNPY